jgi:hypothetical protein
VSNLVGRFLQVKIRMLPRHGMDFSLFDPVLGDSAFDL